MGETKRFDLRFVKWFGFGVYFDWPSMLGFSLVLIVPFLRLEIGLGKKFRPDLQAWYANTPPEEASDE